MIITWENSQWSKFTSGSLQQISHRESNNIKKRYVSKTIFGINGNKLYEFRIDKWVVIPGDYIYVSCAKMDNSTWAINTNNELVKINGAKNQQKLKVYSPDRKWKCISVYSTHDMIGISMNDEIYRGGPTWWEKLDGALSCCSIGIDRSIYGINSKDDIYERRGNKWHKLDGKARSISVYDSNRLLVVNSDGKVYQRTNNTWRELDRTNFGKMLNTSVGSNNCYGVNANGSIFQL